MSKVGAEAKRARELDATRPVAPVTHTAFVIRRKDRGGIYVQRVEIDERHLGRVVEATAPGHAWEAVAWIERVLTDLFAKGWPK